jgi:hypothetical protein
MLTYKKIDMINTDNLITYNTGMKLLLDEKQFEKLTNIVNNQFENRKFDRSTDYGYHFLRRIYNGFNAYKDSNYNDLSALLNYVEILPATLTQPLTIYPSLKSGSGYIFVNIDLNNMKDNDVISALLASEFYRDLLYIKQNKLINITEPLSNIIFNIIVLLFGKKKGFIEDDNLLIILKMSIVYYILSNFFNTNNVFSKGQQYVDIKDISNDEEMNVNLNEIANYIESKITDFSKLLIYLNRFDIKINVNEFVVKIVNYFGYDVLAGFSSLERMLSIMPILNIGNNITKNLINFVNKSSYASINNFLVQSLSNISSKNKPDIKLQI